MPLLFDASMPGRFDREGDAPALALSRRRLLLAGLCLCCLTEPTRANSFDIAEVGPGVFIRRGVDENASPDNLDAIANIGFIIGENGVLVTDSGGSLADGRWLRAMIKDKTQLPVTHVVMSHVHPDHSFGAAAFLEDRPVFIGHAKLREALQARGEFYRQGLAAIIGANNVGPIVMPTRVVAATDEIDLGRRIIHLEAHGPAHTTSDLSMLDRQSGLFFPADLLFVKRIPSLDGSLLGWLKQLDAMTAQGARKAVPGHGPTLVDFAPAAAGLTRYLSVLRDGVRALIRNNASIETAIKTVGQSEREHWTLFDSYHGRNVTEAFKELEWE